MKRLYLTHNPAELAMAWFLINVSVPLGWACITSDKLPLLGKWLMLQLCLAVLVMAGVFLFGMSGSRKRREAAEEAASEREV